MNRIALYAFLSNPEPGIYLLNIQFEGEEISRVEISKAQLENLIVDGAGMAFQEQCRVPMPVDSVRLGAESFT